ncbi:hypothetical protein [Bradyrhizobium sp. 157]|uniref:hypothetical protein n=1 Tax=Bradyrhizobium sp. 157 TaxID=2782631 RepID=UPI001FFB0515|nr:hypothetical protein [Bradyrhizobium sp. 157]
MAGQTTGLTTVEVLGDMKATSLKDALRSTGGGDARKMREATFDRFQQYQRG